MVIREFLLELGAGIKQQVQLGEEGLGIHSRCGQRGKEGNNYIFCCKNRAKIGGLALEDRREYEDLQLAYKFSCLLSLCVCMEYLLMLVTIILG